MGEYLSILCNVKDKIYSNDISEAARLLKMLLNKINLEYTSLNDSKLKEQRKKAIERLLPVLKDLNKGEVTPLVKVTLKLDDLFMHHDEEPTLSFEEETPSEEKIEETKKEIGKILDAPQKPVVNRDVLIPLTLDDYIGQEKAKTSLRYSIGAAKKQNRVLNHLLICSSYGLGKTTLANIIANEMGMKFFSVNALSLKDSKALALYFSKIEESCIIFIDEIHSLKNDVQTLLLSILTDFKVNFINENGEEERHDLPPFTLIGATTQAGQLLKPFLNRFQILDLVDYTNEEKESIVRSKFNKIGYEITDECVKDIALRSRGVPRTIEIYAKGIRDIALAKDESTINKEITDAYFELYEIDENGLTKNDLYILETLNEADKPLALITLESKVGIQREDIEYRYEPYLLKLGLIEKTEKGRVITDKGRNYLNKEEPTEE